MATATQIAPAARSASPLALWHLLSLDAPTVAVVWTLLVARAGHVGLPVGSLVAMALAVWVLYAADRLLDARVLDARGLTSPASPGHEELEARHLFHSRHRRGFLVGIAVAALGLAALLPGLDPLALRLYVGEGWLLLAWFLLIHASGRGHRLPKELAVGLFFASAVFVPTVSRASNLRPTLLPAAMLLAALCSLNCLYIYAWEHEGRTAGQVRPAHVTTAFALCHRDALAGAIAFGGLALLGFGAAAARPIAGASGLASLLLLWLDRCRRRLARTELRAAADLALLTPLVWLLLLYSGSWLR